MKKILIVSNSYWSIFNFRSSLISDLINNGYTVSLAANHDLYKKKLEKKFNCNFFDININSRSLNPYVFLLNFFSLYKLVNTNPFDMVFSFTSKINFLVLLAIPDNKDFVPTINGLGLNNIKNKFLFNLILYLYDFLLSNKVKKVFFHNKVDMNLFKKTFLKKKSILCPGSGINLNFYKLNENPPDVKRLAFVYIGRIISNKGFDFYLSIAEFFSLSNSNFKFYVYGKSFDKDNSLQDRLSLLIKNNVIKFHHFDDNLSKNLCNFDCLIQPSMREGLSKTILEAMASGCVVFASDVVGNNEVVKHKKNGFLFKYNNQSSFIRSLNQFLKFTPYEIKLLKKNAYHDLLTKYNSKIINDIYLKIIHD